MLVELDEPYILIHEKKLSSLQPMLPILEAVVQASRPLSSSPRKSRASIGHARRQQAAGGLKVAAVKAPGFGDRRRQCSKTSPSSPADK